MAATTSQARVAFEANRADVDRLLEIHTDRAGNTPGRKHGVAVLNKAGVVLTCAIWEAYCEDLAAEAVAHFASHAATPDRLPKELRKQLAAELEQAPNELAVWQLADDGWRDYLRSRLADLTAERNRKLNTPKSANIEALFAQATGITKVTASWRWGRTKPATARAKLDRFVSLRGDIAHRAAASESVKKSHVQNFLEHAEKLVWETDAFVNAAVNDVCGVPLFVAGD